MGIHLRLQEFQFHLLNGYLLLINLFDEIIHIGRHLIKHFADFIELPAVIRRKLCLKVPFLHGLQLIRNFLDRPGQAVNQNQQEQTAAAGNDRNEKHINTDGGIHQHHGMVFRDSKKHL